MNWLWRTLLPKTPLPSCGAEIHGATSMRSQIALRMRASKPDGRGSANSGQYDRNPS